MNLNENRIFLYSIFQNKHIKMLTDTDFVLIARRSYIYLRLIESESLMEEHQYHGKLNNRDIF